MEFVGHCYRCGQNKSPLEFAKGKSRRDGYYCYCKQCRKEMEKDDLDLTFKSVLQLRKK